MRNYKPLPLSGHTQTFFAGFFGGKALKSVPIPILLEDGDTLVPELLEHPDPKAPTVVCVPGICGSHTSPYVQRIGRRLASLGYRFVVANHRGLASSSPLCRKVYHPGSSGDLDSTVGAIVEKYPESPLYFIGFSMGGNVLVKWLGENSKWKERALGFVAVVPPLDLLDTITRLGADENHYYERYFAGFLYRLIESRHKLYPDLGEVPFDCNVELFELIDQYVSRTNGFKGIVDLSTRASGRYFVPEIKAPGEILLVDDDPLVSARSLDGIFIPKQVALSRYTKGGHMGFFGKYPDIFWMDYKVVALVEQLRKAYPG